MGFVNQFTRTSVIVIVASAVIFLVIGVLIGHFTVHASSSTAASTATAAPTATATPTATSAPQNPYLRPADATISGKLIAEFDADNIRNNLRTISTTMHRAGTPASLQVADWIAEQYRTFGLDIVEQPEYNVLLSYPDENNPDHISFHYNNGTSTTISDGRSPYFGKEFGINDNASTNANIRFNAYAHAGTASSSCLVYANYGNFEDYQTLTKTTNITNCIVLVRYGGPWRGETVQVAQELGAIGVILYSDPHDYANKNGTAESTFPNNIYMPPGGVQRGTITFTTAGDYGTEFLPAKNYMTRRSEQNLMDGLVIPKIQCTPISYTDALPLLNAIASVGNPAPASWQGSLILDGGKSYAFGGQLKNLTVNLTVTTTNQVRTIRNTIGYIRGSIEPERYVILGNHHDAWVYGTVDPSSGTAVIVEVARVFMKIINETNWRPRRTIIFGSWDAEEYGLIGSDEWVEENFYRLYQKAVAYLNVDIAVAGNQTINVKAVPLLAKVLFEAAKQIPNPDPAEVQAGRHTVYDTWLYTEKDSQTGNPKINLIGSGSDYTIFLDYVGIPSVDFRYTQTAARSYPLYHTMYETMFLMDTIMDKNFTFSKAVGQMWAEIARSLADELVLPLDYVYYNNTLASYVTGLSSNEQLKPFVNNLTHVSDAMSAFSQAASNLTTKIQQSQLTLDEISLRSCNDRLLYLERHFISPPGLPGRPQTRHVVFSPSIHDAYSGETFSGIQDSLEYYMAQDSLPAPYPNATPPLPFTDWQSVLENQISWAAYCLYSAAASLNVEY